MDTIAAIATAQGSAGIGIVRISGAESLPILLRLFTDKEGRTVAIKPRYMHYGQLHTPSGDLLDTVLAVYMPAPHSYTGEDVAEIHCHGGAVVTSAVLDAVLACGARLAFAGEFTQRAFLSGKLDLTQAEAIADIIEAKSQAALSVSERQLSGVFRRRIEQLADTLLDMLAEIEVAVDYPEETEYAVFADEQRYKLSELRGELDQIINSAKSSRVYTEGLRCAIVGSANAGKSTLLNTLLQQERAIVTDVAGTTRDTIEAGYSLDGIPLVFVDTAGIRATEDKVERIGIEKSKREMLRADVVFLLVDGALPAERSIAEAQEVLHQSELDAAVPLFVLINKQDAADVSEHLAMSGCLVASQNEAHVLSIAASTGEGVDSLKAALLSAIRKAGVDTENMSALVNARHLAALHRAAQSLADAASAMESGAELDLCTIDLEAARTALGEITGSTAAQDVIDRIFAKFCLGK